LEKLSSHLRSDKFYLFAKQIQKKKGVRKKKVTIKKQIRKKWGKYFFKKQFFFVKA
jgi:hypothetical protein